MRNAMFFCLALGFWPRIILAEMVPGEPGAQGSTIEEYLQSLSTVPGVVNRRDPFDVAAPPFEIPKPTAAAVGPDMSKPPLQRYPLKNYGVVATLIGDQYPRALLRLPAEGGSKGSVVIVREKDRIGDQDGIIKKISSDGILVSQKEKNAMGFVKVADILLAVGSGGPGGSEQSGKASTSSGSQGQTPARPFQ